MRDAACVALEAIIQGHVVKPRRFGLCAHLKRCKKMHSLKLVVSPKHASLVRIVHDARRLMSSFVLPLHHPTN